jgi:DNA topoisomerase-3
MAPTTVLNVAEKPSVARALSRVFGSMPGSTERPMERRDAQIFTHENVSFPDVMLQGSGQLATGPNVPHTMITTSVRGHLANQDFPDAYGWNKCAPIALFDAPIETIYRDDLQGLERMLRDLSRRAQVLILWLDCDREGEAISDEVRTVCFKGNGRLKVLRAKFSTVLPGEIQRAVWELPLRDFKQCDYRKSLMGFRIKVSLATAHANFLRLDLSWNDGRESKRLDQKNFGLLN